MHSPAARANQLLRSRQPGKGVRRHGVRREGVGELPVLLETTEGRVGVGEVPTGEVWVHCASGYRASIAASLLQARGFQACNVPGSWQAWQALGLPVER